MISYQSLLLSTTVLNDKQFSRINVRKYNFSNQVINDWNNLSIEVVQVPNVRVSFIRHCLGCLGNINYI